MTVIRSNRRDAIRLAASAALVSSLQSPLASWAEQAKGDTLPYLNRIGLQLYTVREQMAADPEATLVAVAKAGYKQVELMNIDDNAIKVAAIARDQGMAVHSGFLDFKCITSPEQEGAPTVDSVLDIAQRIGLRHVVFGYIGKSERKTVDQCKGIAERANQAAEKTRQAGMRMCYHNHSFEFAKLEGSDQTAYDIFLQHFDPQQMEFELDVFWVKIGGQDPIEMMRRLAGRISQVHLKDLKPETPVITDEGQVPKDAFQELGDGVIDMPEVMRLAAEIGVDQCHVEQDQSPAPLESIVQSMEFLKDHQS